MRVLKFGGTSVGSPERMREVAAIINDGVEKIVVMSAVSGTTNSLLKISDALKKDDKELSKQLIDSLENVYKEFISKLLQTAEGFRRGNEYIKEVFNLLRTCGSKDEKRIVAQGELLSTHLYSFFAAEEGLDLALIPALDFMLTVEGEPDMAHIRDHIRRTLADQPKTKIYLTQGFICRNELGEIDNLKRGGSDYTATIIGAAVEADEIQIWTDIDGIHNNDPRIVDATFPIDEISFNEAAEMAYFGAKILHPTCVLPAKMENIPVRLLNTMNPSAKGTIITNNRIQTSNKVKAVAAKDGITAIKIRSSRMLLAYGFLKKVFEVFEKYRTPIDMITTSEVEVSLTIDDATHLENIIKELSKFSHVETDAEQTIICVVGEFSKTDAGVAVRVLETLREIPLRMISSGGSESNVSVLIDSKHKTIALNVLNEGLFAEQLAVVRSKRATLA